MKKLLFLLFFSFLFLFFLMVFSGIVSAVPVLKTFAGFETGGVEELAVADVGCTVVTTPAPPQDEETYVIKIAVGPDASNHYEFYTDSYAHDNDMIFGFYAQFQYTDAYPFNFFAAREGKNNEHFYLRLPGDDTIALYNSTDVLLDTSATGVIVADTWHLVEARLSMSSDPYTPDGIVEVWVDGVEIFSNVSVFDGNGTSGATEAFFRGSAGPATKTTKMYVSSLYYFGNGISTDDFLGDYEIIGPYQNRNASAEPDVGNTLDSGFWNYTGEIPLNETNYAQYTPPGGGAYRTGVVSSWTNVDGEIPGPYGDSRIDGDDNIKGGSFIFRMKSGLQNPTQHCYGDVAYDDINSMSVSCYAKTNLGVWTTYKTFSGNDNLVPNITEYFQFGFKARYNGFMGVGDSKVAEFWNFVLHVPEDWDSSKDIAWKIINTTDVVILNLTTDGNMSIAGSIFENDAQPGNIAFTMNNSFWLTINGDLYITGGFVAVDSPIWFIENITDFKIFKFYDGNIEIPGDIYENI